MLSQPSSVPSRRRPLAVGLGAVAVAALVTACGSSSSGSGSASSGGGSTASGTTVSAHTMSGMGSVLTDSSGKTLYSPQQEANGKIQCTGSCNSFWFPLTVSKGTTPKGSGLSGKLGTIQRPDGGGTQVTYNGKPLYTFKLDSSPGDAKGNDFTDNFNGTTFNWYAVTTSGSTSSGGGSGATPASSPSSGGYNYGSGGGGGY